VDPATIQRIAANVEPYIRADGTSVWSLMQLERQPDPDAFGPRWNSGYLTRRRRGRGAMTPTPIMHEAGRWSTGLWSSPRPDTHTTVFTLRDGSLR
jgi:hypothetical protein